MFKNIIPYMEAEANYCVFIFNLILRFLAGFRGIINPIVLVHSLTGVMVSKRYITLEYICLTRF